MFQRVAVSKIGFFECHGTHVGKRIVSLSDIFVSRVLAGFQLGWASPVLNREERFVVLK